MFKRFLFFSAPVISLAFVFFFFFHKTPYRPITCNTIVDVKKHIEPDCLIATDFDNTLFECVNENQGSDQWFEAGMRYLTEHEKYSSQKAFETILACYTIAHESALIQPVEPTTIPLLQLLQESKTPLIVLTARSIVPQTKRELQNMQNASVSEFSFASFHLAQSPLTLQLSKEPAYYEQGILYCGSNNKGEALTSLINKLQLTPKKIIFIDDKEKHVLAVEQAVKKLQIPFVGLRYAYLDNKIKAYRFDPQGLDLLHHQPETNHLALAQ